ncbi:MAG TPA: flavodoxin family protein [Bacteroidales bacterium]|nr:flavodoxin family protein [Bacteroidales bacterium]
MKKMKVIAFNGSPKKGGNTFTALQSIQPIFGENGVELEILQIGSSTIQGCMACGACRTNKNERCIFDKDPVNEIIQKVKEADGIILASPVYYASINGTFKSFLDRLFYVSGSNGNLFRHKVGAALVVVRRVGGINAFLDLNNYLLYSEMIIPGSNYWNVVYGSKPGEVLKDHEGLQTLAVLAQNFCWTLKLIEHGKEQFPAPERVKKIGTNFIR